MTVGQADTINLLYKSYNDSIKDLQFKIKNNDSLLGIRTIEKDSFYNWKYKYSSSKAIYEDMLEAQRRIDNINIATKMLLVFIIFLQFSKLQ